MITTKVEIPNIDMSKWVDKLVYGGLHGTTRPKHNHTKRHNIQRSGKDIKKGRQ